MTEHDLQRILRAASRRPPPRQPAAALADTVLSRLPAMRFVIPGSSPGARVLLLAGGLGLLTAAAVGFHGRRPPLPEKSAPPALNLFRTGEFKPLPAAPGP